MTCLSLQIYPSQCKDSIVLIGELHILELDVQIRTKFEVLAFSKLIVSWFLVEDFRDRIEGGHTIYGEVEVGPQLSEGPEELVGYKQNKQCYLKPDQTCVKMGDGQHNSQSSPQHGNQVHY